jgi:hypothetical protein
MVKLKKGLHGHELRRLHGHEFSMDLDRIWIRIAIAKILQLQPSRRFEVASKATRNEIQWHDELATRASSKIETTSATATVRTKRSNDTPQRSHKSGRSLRTQGSTATSKVSKRLIVACFAFVPSFELHCGVHRVGFCVSNFELRTLS